MTTGADRALLEAIGADLQTHAIVVLATALPASLDPGAIEILGAPLGDVDRARYSEIQTGRGATSFLVTRSIVRTVLGHLQDRPAEEVELLTSERGKPGLAPSSAPHLYFNTSHSRTQAMVALSRSGDVGVDVEDVGAIDERVVRRSLSVGELERLSEMNAEDRARAFFQLWTVKEACAKATGVGIGVGMRKVHASLESSGRWGAYAWESIDLGPGVAAAVAVRSPGTDGGRISVALYSNALHALFGIDPGFAHQGAG